MLITTRTLRSAASMLLPLALLTVSSATAGVIQSTRTLPPTAGTYGFTGTVCNATGCVVDPLFTNLTVLSDMFVGENQQVTTSATVRAGVYQNLGSGSLGAFLGWLTMPGTVTFQYAGRTSATQLGTFVTTLPAFHFMGSFGPLTIEVQPNPAMVSSGTTTIMEYGNAYMVSSSLTVFGAISLNGGPFVTGPPRGIDLGDGGNVPEPATAALAFLGLAIFGMARRGLRRTA